jgi:Cu(I)/Ag(I) efflux system membrane fusion protein
MNNPDRSDSPARSFFQGRAMALIAGAVPAVAIVSAAGGYWFAQHYEAPAISTHTTASAEPQVLYWYDPMKPDQHFDKPGQSPFMDMPLVPKYAAEGGTETGLRIDPTIVQNLGIRFASVARGTLAQSLDVVGSIGFNQRHIAIVQARSNGFVAHVYARAPGDVIERSAPLVDLLMPEWAATQAEFLALLQSGDRDLIDAARQRLVLLGIPADLIKAIEADRTQHITITIRTPIAGAIESLDVREGMSVSNGSTLARINGLATMWLEAAIPEVNGARVNVGKAVEARLSAYPGEIFKGRVIAVLPEANIATRTLRVRIELLNQDGRLRPGMFAQVRLSTENEKPVLLVASEAVIHTGNRNVVIVAGDRGQFIPTEVKTGGEADGKTVILDGLAEGQKVVASGQFLIDSEASLKSVLARLAASATPGETAHD